MKKMDSYFLSIDDNVFCPPILSSIKKQLNCEQVFICKLDQQQELQYVIKSSEHQPKLNNVDDRQLYKFDNLLVEKIKSYISQKDENSDDDGDDTEPLKKSQLFVPLHLKTPEIVAINNNVSLWGVLLIYDYNYLRRWTEADRTFVDEKAQELLLAIERNVIYQQFQTLDKKLEYYQFFDEDTGLINHSSFLDCLDYEWRNLAREKKPLSLILIDIKTIDTNSNNDRVIPSEIYRVVKEEIKRPADLVALNDRNQILIMLPNTDNKGALCVNQKVMAKITDCLDNLEQINSDDYQCRSSIITCIPNLQTVYESLLSKISLPWDENLEFDNNIYNQNLS